MPSCISESGSHLSSAVLPRQSPHPHVDLDFLALHELALDPVTASYLAASGGVDPTSLDALDDVDDCILDFSDDEASSDGSDESVGCFLSSAPFHLHHLISPGLP